jgi:MYXO-CTERM domain-containing protein
MAVTRTGIGALGIACSDVVVPPGFVGPIQCTDDSGAPAAYQGTYPASQQQLANLSQQVQQQAQPQTNWLIYAALGLAAVALLFGVSRR